MNVGLPGTGIGGMFYLLSAVCMPLFEAIRGGRSATRWRMVGRQLVMALGIAAGIWFTGFLLAVMMASSPLLAAALQGGGLKGVAPNVLRTATLVVSLSTLGLIVLSVWVASLVVRARPRPPGSLQPVVGRMDPVPRRRPRRREYDAA